MKVHRVAAGDAELLDSVSRAWDGVKAEDVSLAPTPLVSQPSVYIQAKWGETSYGKLERVSVRGVHNGELLYFHLAWEDATADDGIRDTDQFADAAAVMFPVFSEASLQSMGSPQAPVNVWYWRPDLEAPYSITAQGTGTTRRNLDPNLSASGTYRAGGWSVVIRRKLWSAVPETMSLAPGANGKVGFAVWQGANQERGGLKAVTLDWLPMEIEA